MKKTLKMKTLTKKKYKDDNDGKLQYLSLFTKLSFSSLVYLHCGRKRGPQANLLMYVVRNY